MAKSGLDIINIMRNVTGRVDSSDPLFTNSVMLGYANDFLNLIMPQEVRLYENKTWWEFNISNTDADPFPVDLDALGYTTIGNLIYIDGFHANWYQNPADFFGKWPETQTYTAQRPVDVLWYNNELVFRGPPDQSYGVKVSAYQVEAEITEGTNIDNAYFWRYVAYGASLDLFSDYGEMDQFEKYYAPFKRYRSLVYARTNQQLQYQRTLPEF